MVKSPCHNLLDKYDFKLCMGLCMGSWIVVYKIYNMENKERIMGIIIGILVISNMALYVSKENESEFERVANDCLDGLHDAVDVLNETANLYLECLDDLDESNDMFWEMSDLVDECIMLLN